MKRLIILCILLSACSKALTQPKDCYTEEKAIWMFNATHTDSFVVMVKWGKCK